MGVFFYILNVFGLLRISQLEEEVGMDISRHKGAAYNHDDGSAPRDKVAELNNSRRKNLVDKSSSKQGEEANKVGEDVEQEEVAEDSKGEVSA